MENEATDINKLCASVPDDLAKIIREYPDIFPDDLPSGLPPERPQDHKIELEPGMQPTVRTQWRLTQPELHELRNQLDYLLAKGFIRPSTSPFAAPIWFTPKRDGGLCMCTDYRALNWVTIKSRYPIARKGELIDKLRGARYFSKIDLRGSYHQIRVFADICHETALRTRYESYEYMPFEVITDARDIAIGAVLMQDFGNGLQPIAYESRKMQSAECNYQVYDKEMLAIVHTFKIWRCYLIGADVTVRTNQKSLQYLRAQPNLNPGRYAGWTIWSPISHTKRLPTILLTPSPDRVYYLRSGTDRIWVPSYRLICELLIQEVHDSNLSGHFGDDKTQKALQWFLLLTRYGNRRAALRGRVSNLPANEIITSATDKTFAAPRATSTPMATRDDGFRY
ncbi:hypothetical protein CLOM_g6977, partial [Closterium sp. NIES-68]